MNADESILTYRLIGFLVAYRVQLPLTATPDEIVAAFQKLLSDKAENANGEISTVLSNSRDNMNEPDYSQLSPTDAGKLFLSYVRDIEQSSSCDYTTAQLRVRLERPALYARMVTPEVQTLENNRRALGNDISVLPPKPLFSPQLCALYGLPASACNDDELTDMVWRVTKGSTAVVDYAQLFRSVITLVGLRENATGPVARNYAADQFPVLAQRAAAAETSDRSTNQL